MARLLLLITTRSYRAGAFLDAAGALGIEVTVGSERPQSLAGLHPDGHLVLDFRDPPAALERILEFAARHPLAAVVAADDECAGLAARACERLALRGPDAEGVRIARDKARSREAFRAAGLLTPHFAVAALAGGARRAFAAWPPGELPCVIKPRGLSASRGVIRADDEGGFVAAFDRVARLLRREAPAAGDDPPLDRVLIERFIPGAEVALEGLMRDGALHPLALFDKPDPLDGPCFEETIYVTPSRLPAPRQEEIARTAARAAVALGIRHGPVHAEFRINAAGVWPLEIAPRSIGGLCSRSLRFEHGESLEVVLLRDAMGLADAPAAREGAAAGVMMIPIPRAGRLRRVEGLDQARSVAGIIEIRLTVPPGAELIPLPEGAQYLGFLFAKGEDPEHVERSLREAHGRLTFDIDAPAPAGEETRDT